MKHIIVLPQFLRKKSSVFKYFPQFDKVVYCGLSQEKNIIFLTSEESHEGKLILVSFIRQSESDLWEACQGLFKDIFTSIEPFLHGIFHFELLSIEMSQKLNDFQWKEFAKGMTSLSHEIPTGQTRFVQYCSILGILTKYADEDFGRITFNPHVKIFYNEPENIAEDLEQSIKDHQEDKNFHGKCQIIFYDLGRQPLYSSQDQQQCTQLQKLSRKLDATLSATINEVAIIDNNGIHDVFKRSQLELDLFGS